MDNKDILELNNNHYLSGKFLVASPFMPLNDIFSKSVIYVMEHDESGAIGLIINHAMYINKKILYNTFLKNADKKLPGSSEQCPIYLGGPIQTEQGFIIHSAEYGKDLLSVSETGIAVSVSVETLTQILQGSGPEKSLLVVGYTKWDGKQLEQEISENFWIVADSDPELIFSVKNQNKWIMALQKLGINQNMFSGQIGHG